MRLTDRKQTQNNRNNASSLGCHTCDFIDFSGNNCSNIVWRQWSDK